MAERREGSQCRSAEGTHRLIRRASVDGWTNYAHLNPETLFTSLPMVGTTRAIPASRRLPTALLDSGVRLFALLLPEYRYASRLQFDAPQNLSGLSEDSGGFMEPLDLEHGFQLFGEKIKQNLRAHTAGLSFEISAFYSLSVDQRVPRKRRAGS